MQKLIQLFSKEKIYCLLFALIFLGALLIRLLGFLNIPDIYFDEASLAFNIFDKSVLGYFGPLEYFQASPPIFLCLTKLCTVFVSDVEYSLRLVPFVSSVFSVFAFYFLCTKFFKNKVAILAAMVLFAYNPKIVQFSFVFKQYSTDILIYILILASYFYLDFNKRDWKFWTLIFLYPLLIWLSYPAMFAFAGVFLAKLIKSKNVKNLIFSLPFVLGFVIFYIFQHHLNSSEMLHDYWVNGFLNRNFSNIFSVFNANFKWFFQNAFNSALFGVFFIFGLFISVKNFKDEKNLLLLTLLFVVLSLSYLHIYPFSQRVSLYVLPLLILFAALPVEYLHFSKNSTKSIVGSVFFHILIFILVASSIIFKIFETPYVEHIETVLGQAKRLMMSDTVQNGGRKILYIPEESYNTVKFYQRFKPEIYDFKDENIYFETVGNKLELGLEGYVEYLKNKMNAEFSPNDTIYYVFVHHTKKPDMLNALYLFAKDKRDFRIYTDNSNFDALIIFKP